MRARRVYAPHEFVTEHGSRLHGGAGDWLVSDGESEWIVAGERFTETYSATATPGSYGRVGTVHGVRLSRDCSIETLEGESAARAGDWLVADDDGGAAWPVTPERFAQTYEPA